MTARFGIAARTAILACALVVGGRAGQGFETPAAESTECLADAAAAERFLANAKFGKMSRLSTGVTRSRKVELEEGGCAARGAWKTIDDFRPVMRFADGGVELQFHDSWKHEVAVYELDKLLALGLVPPTVERRFRGDRGSLQLWVENARTEGERLGLVAPDPERFNRQMYRVRLLRQLTHDTDFNNVGNLLVDADFGLHAIDFSRAFRLTSRLLAAEDLTRFSRADLEALPKLERKTLLDRLGRWLTIRQIEALLTRRDLIVRRAKLLVEEQGEARVLFP